MTCAWLFCRFFVLFCPQRFLFAVPLLLLYSMSDFAQIVLRGDRHIPRHRGGWLIRSLGGRDTRVGHSVETRLPLQQAEEG